MQSSHPDSSKSNLYIKDTFLNMHNAIIFCLA